MKKLLFTGLITTALLVGNFSFVEAETINNFKGQKAEVFTSEDAHQNATGVKTSVAVSFIEDPHNNNAIALVSIKGFIPANLRRAGSYWWGSLYWTGKYNITVESKDNDKVKIIESIPRNKIETVKVNETIGYTVGGNISAEKESASGGINTSYSTQRSISYEQPDFKTTQISDGISKASWDIEFTSTRNGYNKNSYHSIYGNQLFMKSRLYNKGINNLTEDQDLSSLITGGFSPNVVIVLKAPKNIEKSKLILNYNRYVNSYLLKWSTTQWWGENISFKDPIPTHHYYEINWKKHTIDKI